MPDFLSRLKLNLQETAHTVMKRMGAKCQNNLSESVMLLVRTLLASSDTSKNYFQTMETQRHVK